MTLVRLPCRKEAEHSPGPAGRSKEARALNHKGQGQASEGHDFGHQSQLQGHVETPAVTSETMEVEEALAGAEASATTATTTVATTFGDDEDAFRPESAFLRWYHAMVK